MDCIIGHLGSNSSHRVEAHGFNGCLWLIWIDPFRVEILVNNIQFIRTRIHYNGSEPGVLFTAVYGLISLSKVVRSRNRGYSLGTSMRLLRGLIDKAEPLVVVVGALSSPSLSVIMASLNLTLWDLSSLGNRELYSNVWIGPSLIHHGLTSFQTPSYNTFLRSSLITNLFSSVLRRTIHRAPCLSTSLSFGLPTPGFLLLFEEDGNVALHSKLLWITSLTTLRLRTLWYLVIYFVGRGGLWLVSIKSKRLLNLPPLSI